MKKPSPKLVLRSETLRTLAKVDLSRIVGGYQSQGCVAVLGDSVEKQGCVAVAFDAGDHG